MFLLALRVPSPSHDPYVHSMHRGFDSLVDKCQGFKLKPS